MSRKLIIDGNAVYEIDEKCMLKKKLGELKEKKENIRREERGTECCYRKTESFEKISQKGHAVFPHAPFEVKEGTDISIRHSRSHYRRSRIHYCPIRRSSKRRRMIHRQELFSPHPFPHPPHPQLFVHPLSQPHPQFVAVNSLIVKSSERFFDYNVIVCGEKENVR